MKLRQITLFIFTVAAIVTQAQTAQMDNRAMWGSIAAAPSSGAINLGDYQKHNNKILVSWRMLPNDDEHTAFDLYRQIGTATEELVNLKDNEVVPIKATCYQDNITEYSHDITYRLTLHGSTETLSTYTIKAVQLETKVPYVSIPLQSTEDVTSYPDEFKYQANDMSVGDLDGDGQMELVVKRLLTYYNADGTVKATSEGAGDSDSRAQHIALFEAYKLDGTFLWRVMSGPNIIAGNSINFAVADLDGDGCAEIVTKTGEGTVFGDGKVIGDTDGDGRTDYRSIWPAGHYIGDGPKGYGGPEFFSVIDGRTGRELARANFIARGPEGDTPAQWAANWEANDWQWDPRTNKYQWKLANSFRLGVARFNPGESLQVFLGRGVYGRTIVEAWQFDHTEDTTLGLEASLTRLWKVDTSNDGGTDVNKDGKPFSAYAGQGNHAFNVADLDGDGLDEVMYGSCAWDNDGSGLWSSELGHGDANHVGQFLPGSEGLQVFHCLETGKTMVALHHAKDGAVIWQKDADKDNDMGRCLVGDFFPQYAGCEFYYYQGNYIQSDGTETTINTKGQKGGCGMAIWFDGSLSRQLIEDNIIHSPTNGRTFTMYRYDEEFINGTKSNPGWYGDMLGDWREEVILPDQTKLNDVKIFSTWYPTEHRIPWLMTDHTYYMQCVHEQVGYNQPTNLGYYLGSDYTSDADIWAAARKADQAIRNVTDGIDDIVIRPRIQRDNAPVYNLNGLRVNTVKKGVYIKNGKKFVVK